MSLPPYYGIPGSKPVKAVNPFQTFVSDVKHFVKGIVKPENVAELPDIGSRAMAIGMLNDVPVTVSREEFGFTNVKQMLLFRNALYKDSPDKRITEDFESIYGISVAPGDKTRGEVYEFNAVQVRTDNNDPNKETFCLVFEHRWTRTDYSPAGHSEYLRAPSKEIEDANKLFKKTFAQRNPVEAAKSAITRRAKLLSSGRFPEDPLRPTIIEGSDLKKLNPSIEMLMK